MGSGGETAVAQDEDRDELILYDDADTGPLALKDGVAERFPPTSCGLCLKTLESYLQRLVWLYLDTQDEDQDGHVLHDAGTGPLASNDGDGEHLPSCSVFCARGMFLICTAALTMFPQLILVFVLNPLRHRRVGPSARLQTPQSYLLYLV